MSAEPPHALPFIALLLAPLAEEVTQVEEKGFLRTLQKDMQERWRQQMHVTRRAEHLRYAQEDSCNTPEYWAYWRACDAQMLVPAPSSAALRWKMSVRRFQGGRPEWEEAIGRDQEWIDKIRWAGLRD